MKPKRANIFYILQLYSCVSIFAFLLYLITYLLLQSSAISGTPTVKPYDKFDLEKDTETIHHILRKEPRYIPEVDKMVRMVCHRSREQRLEMKRLFGEKYKSELIVVKDIAGYCADSASGEISFGDLLDDCFRSVLGIYKHHLNRELTSPFKRLDKNAIIEILLSIPPEKKGEFLESYEKTFKTPLLEDVNSNLNGDFHNVVAEMINRNRTCDIPPDKIDWEKAKQEAQLLHDGRKKWKNHRCDLDRILMETPIQQLNATFVEFKKIDGKEFEEVLDKHMEKDKRGSYKAMVFFVKDKHDYYARRLEKAMKGLGTQDHVINRIISIHSEDDMVEIATAYQLNTADPLIKRLEDDTTSHHEMLITCLAGKHTQKENI
ncbi:annexin B9-like [Planococcus citri]|uniref:annexin B9-like n=1 Tax=Planococcus citri TaxID=170843 RepID=UPI0031F7B9A0